MKLNCCWEGILKSLREAYSVGCPRAMWPANVVDWQDSILYFYLIQFPVVFSDLPLDIHYSIIEL
jgi:hypothetical protein